MESTIPQYVDSGGLRQQDRLPLVQFLHRHDRARPTGRGQPFFSGREPEINAFISAATGLHLGERGNATYVIEGPPGAGKSALLAQFQEEMRTFPPVGPNNRRWLSVPLRGGRAESPLAVQDAIDGAIAMQLAKDMLDAHGDLAHDAEGRFTSFLGSALDRLGGRVKEVAKAVRERGGGAFGFRIGGAPSRADEDMEMVANRRAPAWWDWQIVLLIDEAQMVPHAGTGTLDALHQGSVNAPISFCAFGLPGTAEALERVGVSRATVAYDRRLGGLDDRAARMAVRRCFGQYGVTHGSEWEKAILERSANWPQHLAVYLNAALSTMKEASPSTPPLGDARKGDLAKAMLAGDANRQSYYDRRIDRLNRDNQRHARHAQALVAWLTRQNGPVTKDDAIEFLEGPNVNLPARQVDDFLSAARHTGLLSWQGVGPLEIPIPSFAGHLLGEPLPAIHLRDAKDASPRPT